MSRKPHLAAKGVACEIGHLKLSYEVDTVGQALNEASGTSPTPGVGDVPANNFKVQKKLANLADAPYGFEPSI